MPVHALGGSVVSWKEPWAGVRTVLVPSWPLSYWRPWANCTMVLGLSLLINLLNKHYLNTDQQEHRFFSAAKRGTLDQVYRVSVRIKWDNWMQMCLAKYPRHKRRGVLCIQVTLVPFLFLTSIRHCVRSDTPLQPALWKSSSHSSSIGKTSSLLVCKIHEGQDFLLSSTQLHMPWHMVST